MGSISRELINYYGISDCINLNIKNFTQQNIDDIFCIPSDKSDIDEIIKVWLNSRIVKYEVIQISEGTSLEGHMMTGYKLSITGDMSLKISYIAEEPDQPVHTARTVFPIHGTIMLPENFNPSSRVIPTIIIEDIFSRKMNSRSVYSNITFMMSADIC